MTPPSHLPLIALNTDEREAAAERGRHLGFFVVSCDFLRHPDECLAAVFDGAIVVQTEFQFQRDAVRYLAIHPAFDRVDLGREPLSYDFLLIRQPNGSVTGSFRRRAGEADAAG